MSSQTETDIVTESTPLFNYLKQEIPPEDLKDYTSPRRIQSIDLVRGFAIIFIMLVHTASGWLNSESRTYTEYLIKNLYFSLLILM